MSEKREGQGYTRLQLFSKVTNLPQQTEEEVTRDAEKNEWMLSLLLPPTPTPFLRALQI